MNTEKEQPTNEEKQEMSKEETEATEAARRAGVLDEVSPEEAVTVYEQVATDIVEVEMSQLEAVDLLHGIEYLLNECDWPLERLMAAQQRLRMRVPARAYQDRVNGPVLPLRRYCCSRCSQLAPSYMAAEFLQDSEKIPSCPACNANTWIPLSVSPPFPPVSEGDFDDRHPSPKSAA